MIDGTEENFKSLMESNNLVLVDFYASWCGPCRMLSPILDKVNNENDDVDVIAVNTDSEVDLSKRYNISALPTVVFVKNGKEVERFSGIKGKKEIDSMVESLRNK